MLRVLALSPLSLQSLVRLALPEFNFLLLIIVKLPFTSPQRFYSFWATPRPGREVSSKHSDPKRKGLQLSMINNYPSLCDLQKEGKNHM